jgi:prepilin-type N-terminal cleavage/methylation domain-containing protein
MNHYSEKFTIYDLRFTIYRPNAAASSSAIVNRQSPIVNRSAFTLIELLVVISIIGVLAAFIIPGLKSVKRQQVIKTASAELKQVEAALENYKAKYGVYPPGNTNNLAFNQLYYELSGVIKTTLSGTDSYRTLDSASPIAVVNYTAAFHIGGVVNCSHGSDEDKSVATGFLPGLPPNRIQSVNGTNVLVTSVRGPDAAYMPLGVPDVNPFRYNSSNPTNNSSAYDLWIDIVISGQTNRISNWSRQPQIIH